MHKVIRFTNGHENSAMSGEYDESDDEIQGWHLLSEIADGEYTACGLASTEYVYEEKEVKSGGITCENCLQNINYYKRIKL